MRRCLHPFIPLILGLGIAQAVGTVQVYLSNVDLFRTLVALRDAGYLVVPNRHVMATLCDFGPALCGGLFFTLSVGAGVSIAALALAWIWERLLGRRRLVLAVYIFVWLLCLYLVNSKGLSPLSSLYFLLIPPVVFRLALEGPGRRDRGISNGVVGFICVLVLAVLWLPQMEKDLFEDLRDYLLLSNPVGEEVNDFYYAYTLYPAQVFKRLDQKTLKSCTIQGIGNPAVKAALQKELLARDYLPVSEEDPVDLTVRKEGDTLSLEHKGDVLIRSSRNAFLSHPGTVLETYAEKADAFPFFRKLTFVSLLLAFPLTLYIFLYTLICLIWAIFSARSASVTASILALAVGVLLFAYFIHGKDMEVNRENLGASLSSEKWQERVEALKYVTEKKLEIADFESYVQLTESPRIPIRYWLVKALSVSQRPETFSLLRSFLDDPHPNVRCMAFSGLGRRGDFGTIRMIRNRIERSGHWYVQWYAYRALRNLGWRQTASG